jgi:hypothetical protein
MLFMQLIRRITMIDKKFWQTIADNWSKEDDGISIPEIQSGGIELIDPEAVLVDSAMDDETYDILADLGIDDF